jgi:hypothetical protein
MPDVSVQHLLTYYRSSSNLELTSFDGHNWSTPVHIGVTGLNGTPSFRADPTITMYANVGGSLKIATSADGEVWSTFTDTGVEIDDTPAATAGSDGQVWTFFRRGDALWYATQAGGTFEAKQVSNVDISCAPSPVLYRGTLYVFHQGKEADGWLWCSRYANGSWQPDAKLTQVGMSQSPAAVIYDDQLYVFHQGRDKDGWLWYSLFNGKTWEIDVKVPKAGMSGSPSPIVFAHQLFVLHQGRSNNHELWYAEYLTDHWLPDTQIDLVSIDDGPTTALGSS